MGRIVSRANEPAFPVPGTAELSSGWNGVTIREWYAGQALAGLLAKVAAEGLSPADVAAAAFDYADAMLAKGG